MKGGHLSAVNEKPHQIQLAQKKEQNKFYQ